MHQANWQQSDCGKKIRITNSKTGATVDVTVADSCPSCEAGHIDLSTGAFDKLGSEVDGLLDGE